MSPSTTSNLSLNTPRDGDSTTSLGNPSQCLTTLKFSLGRSFVYTEEALFPLLDIFFQVMHFIWKKIIKKQQVNLKPSFSQGCTLNLLGALHAKSLVLLQLPSSILLQYFLVLHTEKYSSCIISLVSSAYSILPSWCHILYSDPIIKNNSINSAPTSTLKTSIYHSLIKMLGKCICQCISLNHLEKTQKLTVKKCFALRTEVCKLWLLGRLHQIEPLSLMNLGKFGTFEPK